MLLAEVMTVHRVIALDKVNNALLLYLPMPPGPFSNIYIDVPSVKGVKIATVLDSQQKARVGDQYSSEADCQRQGDTASGGSSSWSHDAGASWNAWRRNALTSPRTKSKLGQQAVYVFWRQCSGTFYRELLLPRIYWNPGTYPQQSRDKNFRFIHDRT